MSLPTLIKIPVYAGIFFCLIFAEVIKCILPNFKRIGLICQYFYLCCFIQSNGVGSAREQTIKDMLDTWHKKKHPPAISPKSVFINN